MSDTPNVHGTELRTTADLRWSDFDRLGHLNQAVYHVLIEQARTAWLAERRSVDLERHHAWVLARVELDYHREVDTSHTQVIVTCKLTRLGTSSVTCHQEIRHVDGTLAASGSSVMVGWDARQRGKRVFGDAERAALVR